MGCCEISKKIYPSEEFIKEIILKMKLKTMSYEEVTDKLSKISIMKDKILKKNFITKLSDYQGNNYYEKEILEKIHDRLQETFLINELLFYIIAFISTNNYEENGSVLKNERLYYIFLTMSKEEELTGNVLEKLLIDYLSYYTYNINNLFINKIRAEHEHFKPEMEELNNTIFASDNINSFVSNMLYEYINDEEETSPNEVNRDSINKTSDKLIEKNNNQVYLRTSASRNKNKISKDEVISKELFCSIVNKYELYDFIRIREYFLISFDSI